MKAHRNLVLAQQQELRPSRRWLAESEAPRAQTLATIERLLPWGELVALVRPHYDRDLAKARGGRPGFGLEMLLRAFCLSLLWRVSYRGLAGSLADSSAMAAFIGTPLARRTPSASRLRAFFHFLSDTSPEGEVMNLMDLLAIRIREHITAAGLSYIPGRIDEPIFKALVSNPGAAPKAAAMATDNQRLRDEILAQRGDADG